MQQAVLVLHGVVSFAIIVLVLLQRGRGADAGASFGAGSAQTLFGPSGGGNVLSQTTTVLVAVFFAASFALALLAKQSIDQGVPDELPAEVVEIDVPASLPADDLPDVP